MEEAENTQQPTTQSSPEHFATFTDRGYQGLYNGETENMIHERKQLQEDEHILSFMGSDELIANAFRASLAKQRLERDQTRDREQTNQIHYQAGRKVRQTIQEFGGTVPELLPTPQKSFEQLEQEEQTAATFLARRTSSY